MTLAKCESNGKVEPVIIRPQWSLPRGIQAAITTRLVQGEERMLPADGMAHFNLAMHVGDDPAVVQSNRTVLQQALTLPSAVPWLNQVHGVTVFSSDRITPAPRTPPTADACVSLGASPAVCAVLTADCLPILLCSRSGSAIAAVHAGWRGLLAGVIEAAVARMQIGETLSAYIGPAIGPLAFEVGSEVVAAFVSNDLDDRQYFVATHGGKYLGDLAALARARLGKLGVAEVVLSGRCTVQESSIFYSHRAGQGTVGRFASLIWRNPSTR